MDLFPPFLLEVYLHPASRLIEGREEEGEERLENHKIVFSKTR